MAGKGKGNEPYTEILWESFFLMVLLQKFTL